MGILEELWYGNISPCERDFKRGSTYTELLGYIVRHEEDLQKRMNDEEKEIFEKFTECTNEMYGIAPQRADYTPRALTETDKWEKERLEEILGKKISTEAFVCYCTREEYEQQSGLSLKM